MSCKYYGDCERQSEKCKFDTVLVFCLWGLNRFCNEQIIKNDDLKDKNKKLKQQLEAEQTKGTKLESLLKSAIDDIARYCCDVCKYRNIDAYLPPCDNCFCEDAFKWRCADEVKELLDDVDSVSD